MTDKQQINPTCKKPQNEKFTTKTTFTISDRELQIKGGQYLKASCSYRHLDIISEMQFSCTHVQTHDKILLKKLFSEILQGKRFSFSPAAEMREIIFELAFSSLKA